ncbi:MAG: sugar kinase [Verrucomicrobiaceae bacterium]|nr:sugar kinase [Verrucomicrobiaceae bacterium]|tara:strand:- start:5755 stop:6681 length:927 start_codon:yes stop_codon:yes gene_type:complete
MFDMEKIGIGIDIGGTEIKAAKFNLITGEILHQKMLPTEDGKLVDGKPAFVNSVRQLIEDFSNDAGPKLSNIGLSAPGLVQKNGRAIGYMPGRLQGIEGLDWTSLIDSNLIIHVINDAHAALMGEVWQGAAKCLSDVVMLTLGTGVGGAIMTDGKLLKGSIGRAGHLGHMSIDFEGAPDICATPGSIEDAIGNATIIERSDSRFKTTHDLIDAYAEGDEFAKEVWLKSLRALAASLVSLINILDPERIVIGGGIAKAGDNLFGPLKDLLVTREWRPDNHSVKVVPAELGFWAGTYGAVYNSLINSQSV